MKLPSIPRPKMPNLNTSDGIAITAIVIGVAGMVVNAYTHGALMKALSTTDRGFETSTVITAPFFSFLTRTATLTKKGAFAAEMI